MMRHRQSAHASLVSDISATKAIIRNALDVLGRRYGIDDIDIDLAVEGYIDDMLACAVERLDSGSANDLDEEQWAD